MIPLYSKLMNLPKDPIYMIWLSGDFNTPSKTAKPYQFHQDLMADHETSQ